MKFLKMHGLGNDFVIMDTRQKNLVLSEGKIQSICDRRRGVGCDQLVMLEEPRRGDILAEFYNADGTQSGTCGNATRCVADIIMNEKGAGSCVVETKSGLLPCRKVEGGIEVDMGPPLAHGPADFTDDVIGRPYIVDMGNPHCVFFVEDAEAVDIEKLGPLYEYNETFPNRTNVEFAHIEKTGSIRVRVWERGAGITPACGSGACAVMVAARSLGLIEKGAEIVMDGGPLFIEQKSADDHILMTGPVTYVFEGRIL